MNSILKTTLTKNYLVSIVLPVYNGESYIDAAVQSVQNQSYLNWELIIVNDGSTDGTGRYLEEVTDARVKKIYQKNMGVSAARNAALDICAGEFITFLDADDVLPCDSLLVRLKYMITHPEVDILDGQVSVRDEQLVIEKRRYIPYFKGLLLPRLLRLDDRVFFGPFYMVRNNLIGNIRFPPNFTHVEDLIFFIELASKSNACYGYIDNIVYLYRSRAGSAMSNLSGLENGYIKLLETIKKNNLITVTVQIYLSLKVAKIMFLSWISKGEWLRGIKSVARVIRSI